MPRKGDSKARGYGYEHTRLRAALLPSAYGKPCPLCGRTMQRGEALDLDHSPDRLGYRGMAHASCNRADGARRGNAARTAFKGSASREW